MFSQRIRYVGIIHLVLVVSILVFGIGAAPVSALDGFPTTAVLDTFDRGNGTIGTNWGGYTSAFSISSNQLDVISGGFDTYTFWSSGPFGADQEAYVTFSQVDAAAPEQSLLLKSQSNTSYGNGVIEVLYDANADVVQVWTFHPTGGWVQRGANIPVIFVNGDQLGARALANGTVEVYKNSVLLASRNITGWALYASGGYIGLWFADATNALLDNFGGGNASAGPTNTPAPVFTNTATSTNIPILTPTNTPIPTFTFTSTPTFTPTNTLVFTPTGTASVSTFTSTPSFTPTNTSLPTVTFTSTPTSFPTNTFTPIPTSAQDIYRVATNGAANSSCGATWSNPCDLQYALSTLANSGDELWVKQGVYTPGNSRTSTFTLKSGVALYGGFIGTESALNQRNFDPTTNNTILSGDIGTVGVIADNVYHVLTAFSVSSSSILDGFTITGGNANAATGNFGGGLYSENSSPTLTNIIFSNNSTNGAGGAMFAVTNNQTLRVNYTAPTLTRVIFSGNTAARGGGLFTQNSSPVLVDVTFVGNIANGGAGGGMNNQVLNEVVDEYSIPILTNVTFSGNIANGGAGLFNNKSNAVLENVTFSGNTANIRGGAILNEGADPILRNVTIGGNTAPAGFGGSIRNVKNAAGASSNPKIYNSILWGNGSEEITSDGTGSTTIVDSVIQGGFVGGTNIITTNPLLGVLANNGGFTQTKALGVGSSALDAGGLNSACKATDQRGVTRPQGSGCDMGAYEFEVSSVPTNTSVPPTATFTATFTPTNTSVPPTVTFTPTLTPTNTSVPSTATFTATFTPTNTPVQPTATFTPTLTPTHTSAPSTATYTPTLTPTNTSVPPTATFTPTIVPSPTNSPVPAEILYLSSTTDGTAGAVAFADEDILSFNKTNSTWAMYFDGSDVGITSDIDAFFRLPDGTILLSVDTDGAVGTFGTVDDSDIIRFTPTSLGSTTAGTFSWYFDGSDVGLSTTAEDIDAIGFAPDGKLVISTLGAFGVTGVSGNDEDLLVFTATTLGATTTGTWALYFDGSDVGLNEATSEQINGVWIEAATNKIYLTTTGNFSVPGLSGSGSDIFICTPGTLGNTTSCTYTSYWVGASNGFAGEIVDGLHIVK